jgi:hypothetical protein
MRLHGDRLGLRSRADPHDLRSPDAILPRSEGARLLLPGVSNTVRT